LGNAASEPAFHLANDLSKEEQRIAYLVFEQISNLAHLMQASARATQLAGDDKIRKTEWFVDHFSSAMRIEQALKTDALKKKIGLAAGTAYALFGTDTLTILAVGTPAISF
jgi:hypothetical protein